MKVPGRSSDGSSLVVDQKCPFFIELTPHPVLGACNWVLVWCLHGTLFFENDSISLSFPSFVSFVTPWYDAVVTSVSSPHHVVSTAYISDIKRTN